MITTNRELRLIIKRIIRESVGRNLQSVSNDPISYDVAYGFDVDVYYDTNMNKWICTVEKDGKIIHGEKHFNTEVDANHYARKVVEKYKF